MAPPSQLHRKINTGGTARNVGKERDERRTGFLQRCFTATPSISPVPAGFDTLPTISTTDKKATELSFFSPLDPSQNTSDLLEKDILPNGLVESFRDLSQFTSLCDHVPSQPEKHSQSTSSTLDSNRLQREPGESVREAAEVQPARHPIELLPSHQEKTLVPSNHSTTEGNDEPSTLPTTNVEAPSEEEAALALLHFMYLKLGSFAVWPNSNKSCKLFIQANMDALPSLVTRRLEYASNLKAGLTEEQTLEYTFQNFCNRYQNLACFVRAKKTPKAKKTSIVWNVERVAFVCKQDKVRASLFESQDGRPTIPAVNLQPTTQNVKAYACMGEGCHFVFPASKGAKWHMEQCSLFCLYRGEATLTACRMKANKLLAMDLAVCEGGPLKKDNCDDGYSDTDGPMIDNQPPMVNRETNNTPPHRLTDKPAPTESLTVPLPNGLHEESIASHQFYDTTNGGESTFGASTETSLSPLLEILSADLATQLNTSVVLGGLSEINLDVGRKPLAWVNEIRMVLGTTADRVVTKEEIEAIEEKVGGFTGRDPARWDHQLHRITACRARQGDVIGVTIQVRKYSTGNTAIISDLLRSDKSILFLGGPSSGKTSLLREISGELSTFTKLCIVDTRNEIGGHGDVPHSGIGLARRIMVQGSSMTEQGIAMIEALCNCKPHVMVVDELRVDPDVQAARVCKKQGIRLLASAQGTFGQLVQNDNLHGLVLDVDELAGYEDNLLFGSKKAVFDCIVELSGDGKTLHVVLDPAHAVKALRCGATYSYETRVRTSD